jgi:hypothetical protein
MFCNCGTGAGAVYRARLESVCWVKPTEGSNPSLSVALARTGCLISRRGRTDGSQGNGGPIPPCPTLLRPAVRDFEGLGGQGVPPPGGDERMARGQVLGGAIPTAMNFLKNGPIPPCPTLLRPAVAGLRRAGRRGNSIRRRRWVFRLKAEAWMNSAVALQRQPYQCVGCFG